MRKLAVLCIGLVGLALLVGCGADNRKSASDGSTADTLMPETVSPAAPPGLREQTPAPGQPQDTVSTRKEVVTGSVDIVAADPIATAGVIADRVRVLDGRIDSRSEQPGTDHSDDDYDTDPSATLTVRVPADKTDAFIDGLNGVGRVTEVNTNRDDVTMQWEDLDARMRALQASVDRLRVLIAGATNTADLLAAEQALSSRQADLDSLTAQKRHLDDQVALSTLTISITTDAKDSDDDDVTNFWDGVVVGWKALVDWLGDAVVFLGKAIPWLGFLAVFAIVVWGMVRLIHRLFVKSGPPAGPPPSGFGPPPARGPQVYAGAPGVQGAEAGAASSRNVEPSTGATSSGSAASSEGAAPKQGPEPAPGSKPGTETGEPGAADGGKGNH